MPVSSVKDIDVGKTITYRSKNPHDTVLWRGRLEAVGTYLTIRPYMNPAAYNETVRQVDPTVPSDVQLLTYFLITVDNDATEPTIHAFANEWIEPGSLNEVSLGNKVTLQISDPLNDTQRIQSILANAGYNSKIVS